MFNIDFYSILWYCLLFGHAVWSTYRGGNMFALIVILVLAGLVAFFAREYLKKFGYMRDFIKYSNQKVVWVYSGLKGKGGKRGMRNIVLRGSKPFCVLVGFKLDIKAIRFSGFDYYGFVRSNEEGVAVISTFMGKGEVEFQFFVNTDLGVNPVQATSTDEDQLLKPDATYPPHFYQKWFGFYG